MQFIPPKFYINFDADSGAIKGCYNEQPESNFIEITEDEYLIFSKDPKTLGLKYVDFDQEKQQYVIKDKVTATDDMDTTGIFPIVYNEGNPLKIIKEKTRWWLEFPNNFPVGLWVIVGFANENNPYKVFKTLNIWYDGINLQYPFTMPEEQEEVFIFGNSIFQKASYEVNDGS